MVFLDHVQNLHIHAEKTLIRILARMYAGSYSNMHEKQRGTAERENREKWSTRSKQFERLAGMWRQCCSEITRAVGGYY